MSETQSTNTAQDYSANISASFPYKLTVTVLPGLQMPFAYRPEDDPIVKSIFETEEYKLPIENFQPKLILDWGGNIGCAAVYFAIKYPDAQIYSVEPEKNNFKLLTFNTAFTTTFAR